MATRVVEQRVLRAVESAIVERSLVAADDQRHGLFAHLPGFRHWSCILQEPTDMDSISTPSREEHRFIAATSINRVMVELGFTLNPMSIAVKWSA